MPVEIVTVGFCPQYGATFRVPGTGGREWTVALGPEVGHCTCPAFRYSHDSSCKHLRLVWEHGCLFNPQWHDAGPNDHADVGIVRVTPTRTEGVPCPGCGEPMMPVRVAV